MRLGVFGGTFNPIHIGHIGASLEFYDRAHLDKLLIIPDRLPPHKEGYVASARHRLAMLKLVYDDKSITGNRNIEISDIELLREGKSYTVVTLSELKELYPDAELFLYVGSDMFYTLESWKQGAQILKMCTVFTLPREKNQEQKLRLAAKTYAEKYGAECIIPDYTPIVSSSTQIRENLSRKNGEKNDDFTKNLLTDAVNRYIMENGLYRSAESQDIIDEITENVKLKLPELVGEKRLSHIYAVSETAKVLAEFFISKGADISRSKVILAALLHDITKNMDQHELCREFGIALSEDELSSIQTVHAITGAHYAKANYGIDSEIFSAIARHTVGGENMTLTEKIIFVSDYCEETRSHEMCRLSRKMLFEMMGKDASLGESLRDFDYITADILGKTIKYLRDCNSPIHSMTLTSFNCILQNYKNDSDFKLLSDKYLHNHT